MLFVTALAVWMSTSALAATQAREVVLREQNDSGVSGKATLTDNGDGTSTLRVQLTGDTKGAHHPAHLHEGTCKGTIPTIRYPIENVVNGRSTTKIKEPFDQLMTERLYINVHPSHDKLWPVIVCGGLADPRFMPATGAGDRVPGNGYVWSGAVAALVLLAAGMSLTARRHRVR